MGRKKAVIDDSEINVEIEFVGGIDVDEFFNEMVMKIIEKINKL